MTETISAGITMTVPSSGEVNWGTTIKDAFTEISSHDHTGSGNGVQLGTSALAADAVTGAKIRLDNNQYLRARNAANSADINILRVNTSDVIELGTAISGTLYNGGASSGASNIYNITVNAAVTSYTQGLMIGFVSHQDNVGTSTVTVNVNSIGNKTLVYHASSSNFIATSEIDSGSYYIMIYDGSNFRLLNPSPYLSLNGAVSAAGTTQGTATAIQHVVNQVTSVTAGVNDGVILPANAGNREFIIANPSAPDLKIYPPSGGTIMGLTLNAPYPLAQNKIARCVHLSTVWLVNSST